MPWYKRFIHNVADHWQVFITAWREQNKQTPLKKLNSKELEFLPAALEVIETPASPAARVIGGLVILLLVVAVVWASLGKIDIVAIAQGKIIPSEHSKVIQPLEAGAIKAIHVHEGQQVNRGDVLIELDATATGADLARFNNEYQAARIKAARLRALINGDETLSLPDDTNPAIIQLQQQLLIDQRNEQKARQNSIRLMIDQQTAAVESTKHNIARLEETVPLLEERAKAIKDVQAKGYVSRMQYLEVEEERINKVQELASQRQQLLKDTAALSEARQNYSAIKSEFKRQQQTELAETETQLSSLSEELAKATNRSGYQKLTSPINGVVQQLVVHTVGGIVTPAQQLMVIVPHEDTLEVEAWVENKDIGFVDPSQAAAIKIEAFPFTKYGTIDGKVKNLSKDAVPVEDVGYVYAARVTMAKSTVNVGNKVVNLSPGMNVTVEIKTGQRRLIEFFLTPLLRGINESARER